MPRLVLLKVLTLTQSASLCFTLLKLCRNIDLTILSQILKDYLKNHCTSTRLVCTHLNTLSMLNPNMVKKIWILKIFEKVGKIWPLVVCIALLQSALSRIILVGSLLCLAISPVRETCLTENMEISSLPKYLHFLRTKKLARIYQHIEIMLKHFLLLRNLLWAIATPT